MAWINNISAAWGSVGPLASNEDFVCREGRVLVTASASPTADEGVELNPGEVAQFTAGDTVSYRTLNGQTGRIWREAR